MFLYQIIRFFTMHPRWLMVVGGIVAAVSAVGAYLSWQDFRAMPDEPIAMSLDEAMLRFPRKGSQTYARITGGRWDCDSLIYEREHTSALLLSDAEAPAALVSVPDQLSCAQLPDEPVGVLSHISTRRFRSASRDFDLSAYPDGEDLLVLCGYCGPRASKRWAIFWMVFVVLGLSQIANAFWIKRTGADVKIRENT